MEDFQDVKECLKKIQNLDDVKKVGVALSDFDTCDKTCLNCRRYYTIEYNQYVTDCADEEDVEFFLCVENYNTNQEINFYLKIIVPVIIVVSFIFIILIWYRRCKRNKNQDKITENRDGKNLLRDKDKAQIITINIIMPSHI